MRPSYLNWLCLSVCLTACEQCSDSSEPHVATPAAAEKAEGSAEPEREEQEGLPEGLMPPSSAEPAPATGPAKRADKKETASASKSSPRSQEKASAQTSKEPDKEPDKAPDKPKKKTVIPATKHVRVEIKPRFQALLDADSRMQPWINQVMKVADRCYQRTLSSDPKASGVIAVRVTMHKNARPTPDVQQIPNALGGVVACATGDLMRYRMPLFTGPEGERHTLKMRFTP